MGQNKSRIIKLGIFIATGIALFIAAIFYIGSQANLFTKTFDVYTMFKNVSGLSQGSSVQFAGINVGTIKSIEIIESDKVKVNISIIEDVQKFIKKDSETTINSDGLVGNKVLLITSGGLNSPSIEAGDSLHSIQPISFGDILNNLNETTKEAEGITKSLGSIMKKVDDGEGTLGKLVNESSIYDNLDSLMGSFANSTSNINRILSTTSDAVNMVTNDIRRMQGSIDTIVNNISDITGKINSSQSLVGTLLTDTVFANNIKAMIRNADQTTANLEMGSFSFYQNMEALKHNFLFKGYFEDLGYWNKSEFDLTLESREERILNKENDLNTQEVKLREYQVKLDSIRNALNQKLDSLHIKEEENGIVK
ncbi:MAG TPA: MlaD family protein [Ignavibacteria bacterium]|nr:MlaD family protein [Ignavibacteria bacterium]HMR40120.1 MlaD family protein [Ignavibacteria bacterium]